MSNVETAVQYALAQVGKPYVWGTAGPNTFDCSGLVMAAFRHAGFKISRVTYTQIRDGSPVSRPNMRRGDLWFTDPGHVAIYLGGGQFVEAPNSRSRVRVAPVRNFYAGRRIGAPSSGPPAQPPPDGGTEPIGLLPDISGITDAVRLLTDRHTWVRIAVIGAGIVLLLLLVRQVLSTQIGGVVDKVSGIRKLSKGVKQ